MPYVIFDSGTDKSVGAKFIETYKECVEWNEKHYGVFHTVNTFELGKRKKENLVSLGAWAADCDETSKESQIKRINNSPLYPSCIVESKNGYHVYWYSKTMGKDVDTWKEIMRRIQYYFQSDSKIIMVTALLRTPGFYHWKDIDDPFMIKRIHKQNVSYTNEQMLSAFPGLEVKKKLPPRPQNISGNDVWERVYNMNCKDALLELSGTKHVNGETFNFTKVGSGNYNIIVNDKSTSCFLDKNFRIGSNDRGGPTMFNWLSWYGHSNKDVYGIMEDLWPKIMKKN